MKKKKQKNQRKINNFKTISKAIAILYSIIYIAFIIMLLILNVLPFKYLAIILLITGLISVLIVLFLWNKRIKKKFKVTSLVFSIILMIIYIAAGYYMYYAMNFMDNIKKIDKETETFYVLALKDSKYEKIEDLKDKDIYILKSKDSTYQKAQEKLIKKVGSNLIDLESSNDLIEKLDEDEAIFISKSLYELLSEKQFNIDERTKVLYKINVEKESKNITKKVDVFEETFNIYISGIDTSGNISNVARSDVNMVMTVNPKTHKILLTSIPRDYYVTLHSSGGKDKLTHSGMYGINESVQTIEDLLNIDINYYFRVNFTTVIDIVDVIGGINVNSDYSFRTHGMGVKYNFVQGNNYLDGKKALAFSRERKSFKDGDRQRVKNQQKVLSAILSKITSSQTILTRYSDILTTVQRSFQTNLEQDDIKKLIKKQIDKMPSWEIETISLTGTDARNSTYTYGNQLLYVMQPDEKSVEVAKSKISEISSNK